MTSFSFLFAMIHIKKYVPIHYIPFALSLLIASFFFSVESIEFSTRELLNEKYIY